MTLRSSESLGPPAAMHTARGRRSWIERIRLVAEIVAAYVRTRRTLGRAPIAVVLASLRTPKGRSPGSGEDSLAQARDHVAQSGDRVAQAGDLVAQARDLGSAVERTLALMPGDARCLTRSLVLTRLLARREIPAKLVIGTRTAPDFIAHAWVEQAGHPVLSPGDGSLDRLVELARGGRPWCLR